LTASGNQDDDGESENTAGNRARVIFRYLLGAMLGATPKTFKRL
jgi:hypothetical protein